MTVLRDAEITSQRIQAEEQLSEARRVLSGLRDAEQVNALERKREAKVAKIDDKFGKKIDPLTDRALKKLAIA